MLLKRRKKKARKTETDNATDLHVADQDAAGTPKYKQDVNAFSAPEIEGEDHISKLPSELLDHVLSYCVLDHEPEAGARQFKESYHYRAHTHVLLSLAAMSKHFKAHVESFCLRELTKNKTDYRFRTNEERSKQRPPVRRSPRLLYRPTEDRRCYRMELVRHLQLWCIRCNSWCPESAVMASAVKCCRRWCQPKVFGETINLTTALKTYDLRDWMLLPTRQPGPRTKNRDLTLPVVPYGTLRVPKPFMSGWMFSYHFLKKDVEAVAKIVHGDVESHMQAKEKKKLDRRHKRIRETHRKLKLRYHRDQYDDAGSKLRRLHHQKRIEHYENGDRDSDDDSAASESGYGYGNYGDEHEHFCFDKDDCDYCYENGLRKYCPWW